MPATSAYSKQQIDAFFDYISLPAKFRNANPSVELLNALHIYTITRVPYENLSIHYNPQHAIDLDPQHLYQKIVGNARGRGGYCMENAIFYHHILLGLGFDVYTAPAKNRTRTDGVPQGDFVSWVHITNVVTFDNGSKYSADVAFGGDGPRLPMPMIDGLEHHNMGTQDIRLVRDWLPAQTKRDDDSQKYWVYQYRNGGDREWNSFYAFLEMEFLPRDWNCVSWFTSTNPVMFHTYQVLIVMFLRRPREDVGDGGEDGLEEIYGKRMLVNGVVKENLGGKTVVVQHCKTEAERVQALKHWFRMELSVEERAAIRGWKTELK